jgi:hypothetical protein
LELGRYLIAEGQRALEAREAKAKKKA